MNDSVLANYTLDELLELNGLAPFNTITFQFIIPTLGLIGLALSCVNACIYFGPDFAQPMFVYYKVLVIVFMVNLGSCVPYGFCYSPKYLPAQDSYSCAIVQTVYIVFTDFLFHYAGAIEIAIILDRMANFSRLVKKYFVIKPRNVCLILFVTCLAIDSVYAFAYRPESGGEYHYLDSHGELKYATFYFVGVSSFAKSTVGTCLTMLNYVLRDLCTLVIGIVLNIASVVHLNRFYRQRIKLFGAARLNAQNSRSKNASGKLAERNNLCTAIILCAISLVTRTTSMLVNFYQLIYSKAVTLGTVYDLILVSMQVAPFFVFYSFNKNFRNNFRKLMHELPSLFCLRQ